ncbi:DUF6153 family protein, partial [Streptomyces racemochromogenes]
MRTRAGRVRRPGGPAGLPLLVLAVLVGLLAMHGLGPGGLPHPAAAAPAHAAHAATAHATASPGAAAHTAPGGGHHGR